MLTWALIFAVIALVAGVFGFGGVASAMAGVARILPLPCRFPRHVDPRASLAHARKRPQPVRFGHGRQRFERDGGASGDASRALER
jgi:hypothetical protein